jgi:hypothetical protein
MHDAAASNKMLKTVLKRDGICQVREAEWVAESLGDRTDDKTDWVRIPEGAFHAELLLPLLCRGAQKLLPLTLALKKL